MVGCLLLAFAQSVTFEGPAQPVGRLLETLSRSSPLALKAAPALRQEVVFLKVESVSLTEVRARLAQALQASWVTKSDGLYLDRTPAQEREIRRNHVALRRQYVDLELDKIRKSLEAPFDGRALASGLAALPSEKETRTNPALARQRYVREQALFNQGPVSRLLQRLLLACSRDDLAGVERFSRSVFRLRPTLRQRPFDAKAYAAAVADFAKEQLAWSEAAGQIPASDDRESRMVTDPRAHLQADLVEGAELQLDVYRGERVGLLSANLVLRSTGEADHRVIGQAFLEDPQRKAIDAVSLGTSPTPNEPPLEFSPTSTWVQSRIAAVTQSRNGEPLDELGERILMGLETLDPMGWQPTDVLAAYAKKLKRNVVAALPDRALMTLLWLGRESKTGVEAALRLLTDSGTLFIKQDSDWVVIEPADRFEQLAEFVPRKPLVELLRATKARGGVDFGDYATYAFGTGQRNRTHLGLVVLMLFDPSLLATFDATDWNALRLYGSFSPQQRRDLENGARFAFSGLSKVQRDIVEQSVYGGVIRSLERTDLTSSAMRAFAGVEPTESYATGLPPKGQISAKVQSIPVLVAYGRGQDGKVRAMRTVEPRTVATIELEVVGNPQKMAQWSVPNLVGYAPGAIKNIGLRIEVEPGVWVELNLAIPDFGDRPQPVAWDKLPSDTVRQITEAMDQIRRGKAESGRSGPPP